MSDLNQKIAIVLGYIADWFGSLHYDRLIGAALLILLAFLLRRPMATLLTVIFAKLLSAIGVDLSSDAREKVKSAFATILVAVAVFTVLILYNPPTVANGFVHRMVSTVVVLTLYGLLFRNADQIIATMSPGAAAKVGADTNWIGRLFRLAIAVLAIATVTDVWGLSISGALTGVGVLGAGLAIAAQDFVSNFVAGLNNISERRFSPGDWIKVENDVEGTVVSMDLRSTTVLGFDRVPRYVPNSNLANAVLMNYNRMDHRQINWTFGILRDATDEQVEAICADLRQYVEDSGEYVTNGKLLCFVVPVGLSQSAIEINIYVFAKTVSFQTYLEVCGRLTLALRGAVERAGTNLAYPTRTVFVENTGVKDVSASGRSPDQSASVSPADDPFVDKK